MKKNLITPFIGLTMLISNPIIAENSKTTITVTKAIIPAAGFGTRMLTATKAEPKEMVPLINKPAIEYIAQECVDSGVKDIIIVTNAGKEAIKNHFSPAPNLEKRLEQTNKSHLLDSVNLLMQQARFSYVLQHEQLGMAHAVEQAQPLIKDEYVAVVLPDDLIRSQEPGLKQLIDVANQVGGSVIAVQEIPMSKISSYGVVAIKNKVSDDIYEVSNIIEKPSQEHAPSNLAIVGRYVLSSTIFESIDIMTHANGGYTEPQFVQAMVDMINKGHRIFAYKFKGVRHDTGNPVGFMQATIDYGLAHPDFGAPLKAWITQQLANHKES